MTTMTDFTVLNKMKMAQLVTLHNHLVEKATATGHTGYKPVKLFHDKQAAVNRCAILDKLVNGGTVTSVIVEGDTVASIIVGGQTVAHVVTDDMTPALPKKPVIQLDLDLDGAPVQAPAPVAAAASDGEVNGETNNEEVSVADENGAAGPGLSRMRANLDGEALRKKVLADQEAATALAQSSRGSVAEDDTRAEAPAPSVPAADLRKTVDAVVADLKAKAARKAPTLKVVAPIPRPKAPPPKAAPPKREQAKRGRKSVWGDDQVITLLVKQNPKKPGSAAHGRFAKYKTGMTVMQALRAGVTTEDLTWDTKKAFIRIR